jgi:LacI family xylobiose transport system transcriptional regulator
MTSEIFATDDTSRATLSRIALEAQVSISTVSKVLNGRPGISDETRERVESLLQDLGYNRRAPEKTHGGLVEIVFEEFNSEWSLQLLRGVERVASENHLSVVVSEIGHRGTLDRAWLDGIMQRRPVGIILVFSTVTADQQRKLGTRDIPFVIVDPAGDPSPEVPAIGSTNWAGGFAATRHLLDLGHRRIAMIAGPGDMLCSRARVSGYRSALEAAGIHVDPSLIATGDFSRDAGITAGLALLETEDPPTAFFAGNDLQAFGVYEAARTLGLSVPNDVSVVGFDDLPVAAWFSPPLTTVRQPLMEMAETATRMILRLRDGDEIDSQRVDLATSLVVRESTREPRR